MNSCWSPVFWCNNGGTSLSHPPPSPNPPYIASYLSILWIPVEVPYFDVIMVELRSLTPPPSPNPPYIASYLSILWIPVEFPYFNVTMVELCSLIPPLPHFTLHCFISVNFMNSCWSPVFWCNNGGTLLSHPPSPIPPYIASYLSILWIPVEVPYFDVTMVELRSLIPPPPPPFHPTLLHICQFYEFLLKSRILM